MARIKQKQKNIAKANLGRADGTEANPFNMSPEEAAANGWNSGLFIEEAEQPDKPVIQQKVKKPSDEPKKK